MGVLDELVARAHRRAQGLGNLPLSNPNPHVDFRDAIAGKDRISVIAEFKRCSPSLGQIRTDADITRQVKNYIEGGASAISVLTEPTRFRGSYEDLRFAVAAGDAPALMKDSRRRWERPRCCLSSAACQARCSASWWSRVVNVN